MCKNFSKGLRTGFDPAWSKTDNKLLLVVLYGDFELTRNRIADMLSLDRLEKRLETQYETPKAGDNTGVAIELD